MKKEEKDLAFEELEDRLEMAQIAAADVTRCSIGCEKQTIIILNIIL